MNGRATQDQMDVDNATYVKSRMQGDEPAILRLVELVAPQKPWRALDLVIGTEVTATAFSPFVTEVMSLGADPLAPTGATALAATGGLSNVAFVAGDPEDLPFDSETFDRVTCHVTGRHDRDSDRFVSEAVRVLRPGGILAAIANIVPGSRLRGKKAGQLRAAGEYVNAFERLRNPAHTRWMSIEEWQDTMTGHGLAVAAVETRDERQIFEVWAAQQSPQMRYRLRAMLLQAPSAAQEYLDPRDETGLLTFQLREGWFSFCKQPAGG